MDNESVFYMWNTIYPQRTRLISGKMARNGDDCLRPNRLMFSHTSGTCGEEDSMEVHEEGDTGAVGTEGSKWVNIMETHTLYH